MAYPIGRLCVHGQRAKTVTPRPSNGPASAKFSFSGSGMAKPSVSGCASRTRTVLIAVACIDVVTQRVECLQHVPGWQVARTFRIGPQCLEQPRTAHDP